MTLGGVIAASLPGHLAPPSAPGLGSPLSHLPAPGLGHPGLLTVRRSQRIREFSVIIVGIGGIGSVAAEMLTR